MNKLIQITKIAILTIILAEEVRKAKRTYFLKGSYDFYKSNDIAERLLKSNFIDNIELSDEFLDKFHSN